MVTSTRSFDPRRLDVAAFAAAGADLAGAFPLAASARLAATTLPSSLAAAPPVTWRLRGERTGLDGAGVQAAVRIDAEAEVTLECQRCLQPLVLPLQAGRRIFFVEGEDAAAALDLEHDDDVLALTPALDVQALVEDELLLALPIVPRHDVCPQPLPRPFADPEGAPGAEEHPFAALGALKRAAGPG